MRICNKGVLKDLTAQNKSKGQHTLHEGSGEASLLRLLGMSVNSHSKQIENTCFIYSVSLLHSLYE